MLSNATLERVSIEYRNGYRAGYAQLTCDAPADGLDLTDPKPFAHHDYVEGHRAGSNDAYWALVRAERVCDLAARQTGGGFVLNRCQKCWAVYASNRQHTC